MNIMLINFNDIFFRDVAVQLGKKGVNVKAIVSHECNLFSEPCFKDSLIVDARNFSYRKKIKELESKMCLSQDLIEHYRECESLFLTISDRLAYFPISVQERKKIYYRLLSYWYGFLSSSPIDAIIFDSTPHMGWDNILYFIAKDLNITVLWPQRTLLNNKIFLLDDYKKIEKVPPDYFSNTVDKELLNLAYGNNIWLKRSKDINKEIISRNKGIIYQIKSVVNFCCRVVFKWRFFQTLFSKTFNSALSLNNVENSMLIYLISIFHNIRVSSLFRSFNKRISEVDYKSKYVVFAMHFQPERSTLPEGGVFEDQFLAIHILAKALPDDWNIYVKEHPRQFAYDNIKSRHYRSIGDYTEILKLPNVKFISINENTEKLIENSICTATITGSIGWETILQKKPSIVFGRPWYSACNSCFVVSSIDECKAAIQEVIKKRPQDVEKDLYSFLNYLKEKSITSSNAYISAIKSSIDYGVLVDNFADGIIKKC